MILFRMENVAFVVLFIVKCRSITPILMISAIPAYHSPPCGGGVGGGALWGLALWGFLWGFLLKTQTF